MPHPFIKRSFLHSAYVLTATICLFVCFTLENKAVSKIEMSRECASSSDLSNDAIVFVLEIVPADTRSFESLVLIRQESVSWRISEWIDCEMKSLSDLKQDTGKNGTEKSYETVIQKQESDEDIEESMEGTKEMTQLNKNGLATRWVEEAVKDKDSNFASNCDSLQETTDTANNASNELTSKAQLNPVDISSPLSTKETLGSLFTTKKAISLLDVKIFTNSTIDKSTDPATTQQLGQTPSYRSNPYSYNPDILLKESSQLHLSKLVACRVIEPPIFDVVVFESNGKFSFLQHGHNILHNSSKNTLILAIKRNTIPNLSDTAALFANDIIFIIQNDIFLSNSRVSPTCPTNDSRKWYGRKWQNSNSFTSAFSNKSYAAVNKDKIQVSTLSSKRIQHIIINEISRYVAISKDIIERSIFALLIHS